MVYAFHSAKSLSDISGSNVPRNANTGISIVLYFLSQYVSAILKSARSIGEKIFHKSLFLNISIGVLLYFDISLKNNSSGKL